MILTLLFWPQSLQQKFQNNLNLTLFYDGKRGVDMFEPPPPFYITKDAGRHQFTK